MPAKIARSAIAPGAAWPNTLRFAWDLPQQPKAPPQHATGVLGVPEDTDNAAAPVDEPGWQAAWDGLLASGAEA